MKSVAIAAVAAGFLLLAGRGPAMAATPVETAGYEEILHSKSSELKVFSYDGNPNIVILDIPSLEQQGNMFNRVVALVERIGVPRDRVFTNDELAQYIKSVGRTQATFAFGNDFRVSELVVFYNLADFGNVELTEEEVMLRDFLLEQGYMRLRNGFLQTNPPDRVILSIPQEQSGAGQKVRIGPMARMTILRHELSHGEYYSNPDYTNYCRQFWRNSMSEAERQAFRSFLGERSYSPTNEEMMINESQAYLMHTPDRNAFNPGLVKMTPAAVEDLRRRFLSGNPPSQLFQSPLPTGR